MSAETGRSEQAIARIRSGTFWGFVATMLWSSYGVLVISADRAPPWLALAVIFTTASLTLIGRRLLLGHGLRDLLGMPLATLALGFLGLFGNNALYVLAVATGASPVSVNIAAFSWPIMMVVLVILAGLARATWWDALALLLGFLGMGLVSLGSGGLAFDWGLAIALVAALLWAVYSAFRPLVPAGPSDSMAGFVTLSALAAWLAHGLAGEPTSLPADDLLALALVGLLPVGLANLLWDYGARCGDPVLLAGLSFIEPMISTSLIAFVLAKPFGAHDVAGLLLIVLGVLASVQSERARRRAELTRRMP